MTEVFVTFKSGKKNEYIIDEYEQLILADTLNKLSGLTEGEKDTRFIILNRVFYNVDSIESICFGEGKGE